MAWEIRDEWIDLAQAKHFVIYHNKDVLVPDEDGKPQPVEHHLVNQLKLNACPTCGHKKGETDGLTRDFAKDKADMHSALQAHHKQVMQYREKHPHVRLGSGPKK